MSAPICSVHGTPMITKGKGYFCPKKVGNGWCDQRESAPKPSQASTVAPQASPGHLLALGALDAASRVYQGTADASGFLDLANQIVQQFGTES